MVVVLHNYDESAQLNVTIKTCTMVGVVIKGADSAIYSEDVCAAVQYTYCTLAHVHTTCSIVQYMEPCR